MLVPMSDACAHCSSSNLEHKGFIVLQRWITDAAPYGEFSYSDGVYASQCLACGQPTIWRGTFCAELDPEPLKEVQLYPREHENQALPARVRARLGDAARVRSATPSAYAVAVRRVVEAICNHEGAEGRDLYNKLDDLASKGRLPQEFADMGHQIREFGKLGAHDLEDDVTVDDIPAIDDFKDALLDFCYRAPAKIDAVRQRLEKRKLATQDRPDGELAPP
jgi:Domain of unknown function (DUF4145)